MRKLGRAAEAAVASHRSLRAGCRASARTTSAENGASLARRGVGWCARAPACSSAFCASISARFSRQIAAMRSQSVGKARHAVARALREVGAAEERRPVRREEHGERPAAGALREHLVRGLVDLVEVGPLLAVDLHVDEKPVHHRCDLRILEALVRHDVAPMARGVADREQDRLVLGAGARERFLAPGIPVHRVGGVLLQVRRGFADEAVRHRRKRNPRASGGFLLDGCQLTEPSG